MPPPLPKEANFAVAFGVHNFAERRGRRSLPERYFYGEIGYAELMAKISLFRVGQGLAPAEKSHRLRGGLWACIV